jgi:threonine/homoserine/homoserine lactone efflux protein
MFGIENYLGFIIAAIILTLTPGVDTMYIITRSIAQGRKAGLISVVGIMSGCIIHVLCTAFGLSLILSTSAIAFTLVKFAGALYLIYLGIKIFFQKTNTFETSQSGYKAKDLKTIYKQGVLTNVLNPKVALFFLSFLPQFINPDFADGPMPFLILGATFLVIGTLWCLFLAWSAALMTNTLRNNNFLETILQKLSGIIFIGFGLKIALFND